MAKNVFFGGSPNDFGTTARLPQTSFQDLVQQLFLLPQVLTSTRAEYRGMCEAYDLALASGDKDLKKCAKGLKDTAKASNWICSAYYENSPTRREAPSVKGCNLICIDIDDPRHAKPLVTGEHRISEVLKDLNYVAYYTATSTDTDPKLRVIVHGDDLAPERYKEAVGHVQRLLALPSVTTESLRPSQLMYLPVFFKDDDLSSMGYHPVISSRIDGRPLKDEEILGAEATSETRLTVKALGSLEYARQPIEEANGFVEEALATISSDCSYTEWQQVCMMLKHQFQTDDERGYDIFDRWSAKASKYAGAADTRAKWNQCDANPADRAPVTIRTLFHQAAEKGWDPSVMNTRTYKAALAWITESTRSSDELMKQGLTRIAKTPFSSPIERDTLINTLQRVLKARDINVSIGTLRKALKELEQADAAGKAVSALTRPEPPNWAKALVYVCDEDVVVHPPTGSEWTPPVFDRAFSDRFMTAENLAAGYPDVLPFPYLRNVCKIMCVNAKRYDPRHPDELVFEVEGRKYLNTYRRPGFDSDPTTMRECGDAVEKHLRLIIREEEYVQYLLDYLAYCVQFPGKKINWAPVVQGGEGAGKTTIALFLAAALGDHNVYVPSGNLIVEDKNTKFAEGHQICAIEELRVPSHRRTEVMGKLKPYITNRKVTIRKMRVDEYEIENITNYMMFTNHTDAIEITDSDRRYFVLFSSIQTRQDYLHLGVRAGFAPGASPEAASVAYFTALYALMAAKPGGFKAYFEARKIRDVFSPFHAPRTTYHAEMAGDTKSALVLAIEEILDCPTHPLLQPDCLSISVLTQALKVRELKSTSPVAISSVLRGLGYSTLGRFRDAANARHHVWAQEEHVSLGLTGDEFRDRSTKTTLEEKVLAI